MARAVASPTPNPNAMKFNLDAPLVDTFNVDSIEAAAAHPFTAAVFAAPGVVRIFGVNDFVTVSRADGAEWDPIVAAVDAAAGEHL